MKYRDDLERILVRRPLAAEDPPQSIEPEDLARWRWWTDTKEMNGYRGKGSGFRLPVNVSSNSISPGDVLIARFCDFYASGAYPPEWVMEEIFNRFSNYLIDNCNGKREADLGKYFHGKKCRLNWKKIVDGRIEQRACFIVFVLEEMTLCGRERATEVATLYIEDAQSKQPLGWKDKRPKGKGQIKDYYKQFRYHLKEEFFNFIRPDDRDEILFGVLHTLSPFLDGYRELGLILEGLKRKFGPVPPDRPAGRWFDVGGGEK